MTYSAMTCAIRQSLPQVRGEAIMSDIDKMNGWLKEVEHHLESQKARDKRLAAERLERIVAIASTLADTIRAAHK